MVIETVTRTPSKESYTFSFLVKDLVKNQNNQVEKDLNAKTILDIMARWADSRKQATPITLHYDHEIIGDCKVFVEPNSFSIIEIMDQTGSVTAMASVTVFKM